MDTHDDGNAFAHCRVADMAGQHRNQTTTDAESLTSRLRVRACLKSTQGIAIGYRFRAIQRFAFASGPFKQGVGVELTTYSGRARVLRGGGDTMLGRGTLILGCMNVMAEQQSAPLPRSWCGESSRMSV
jgi:hypothetical protein